MKTVVTMDALDHYRIDLIPESDAEKMMVKALRKGDFNLSTMVRSARPNEPDDGRLVVDVNTPGNNGVGVELQEVDYEVVDENGDPAFIAPKVE